MIFSNIDIKKQKDEYTTGELVFKSKRISDLFATNEDLAEDFIKISLFVDKIYENKLENVDDVKNIEAKELFTEAIYSTYEYIHNKGYLTTSKDIDTFIKNLEGSLKNIIIEDFHKGTKHNNHKEADGFSSSGIIYIADKVLSDSDEKMLSIFAHEFAHNLSSQKAKQGIYKGFSFPEAMEVFPPFKAFNEFNGFKSIYESFSVVARTNNLNECETEYLSVKFLEKNFDIDLNSNNYSLKKDGEVSETFLLESRYISYIHFAEMAPALNALVEELEQSYFDEKHSLKNLLKDDKELFDDLFELTQKYTKLIKTTDGYRTAEESYSFESWDKFQQTFENLMYTHLIENRVSDEKYFEVTSALLERSLKLSSEKISVNKLLVAKLDLAFLGELDKEGFQNARNEGIESKIIEDLIDYYTGVMPTRCLDSSFIELQNERLEYLDKTYESTAEVVEEDIKDIKKDSDDLDL